MSFTPFTPHYTDPQRTALVNDAKRRAQALRQEALRHWGQQWIQWLLQRLPRNGRTRGHAPNPVTMMEA